jgi:hypothetical protein
MMGLLIRKSYFIPVETASFIPTMKDEIYQGQEWMGIYFQGKKIGYAVADLEQDGDEYRIMEKSFMKMSLMGIPRKVNTRTEAVLGHDYRLRNFIFFMESEGVRLKIRGSISGRELELEVDSGGGQRKEKISLREVPYLSANLRFRLLKEKMEKGDRFRFPFFDPVTMNQKEMIAEVEGKEVIRIGDQDRESYRVRLISEGEGISFRMWVSSLGEQLKVEGPMGITFVKESREEAMTKNWPKEGLSDLILSTSIRVDEEIPNPRNLTYLKVLMMNVPLKDFAVWDERQKRKGFEVDVKRESLDGLQPFKIPYRGKDMEIFLRPSHLIQSDDPKIIKKTMEILKNETEGLEATKKLLRWINEFIFKTPTISIPSALEVLETRQGDCNEYAVLFTAMARAAGIPAKICMGIVYMDRSFYYHAWSEVFLGRWIAVDPMMNQIPADPTHIKFSEGGIEKQAEMIKVIGKLKIKILGYR